MRYLLIIPFFLGLARQVHSQCNVDSVFINALLIDPSGDTSGYDTNGDGEINSDDEFIEICNHNTVDSVDISGWQIGDDDPLPFPDFILPDGTIIPPGECILLVHDYCPEMGEITVDTECITPPGVIDMNSTETSLLGNAGDVVTLINQDSTASCSVVYGDVECGNIDPFDAPFFDPAACDDWGDDMDGCALLASGDSCSYVPMVLPIELLYFEAREVQSQKVLLSWSTASETQNEKFEILWRSEFDPNFTIVGEVLAGGNSTETKTYSHLHKDPKRGLNYYRLRQLDYSGIYSYSDVRTVVLNTSQDLQLYPTLVNTGIFINGSSDRYLVDVFNISGEIILKKLQVSNNEFIDLASLITGYYVVRIFDGQSIISKKIVKN